jgi:hypothetical protein
MNPTETTTELLDRLATPALKMRATPAEGTDGRPWGALREIARELGHNLTLTPEVTGPGDGPFPVTKSNAVPDSRYPDIDRRVRITLAMGSLRRSGIIDDATVDRLFHELGVERTREYEEGDDQRQAFLSEFLSENRRKNREFWNDTPWRLLGQVAAADRAGTLTEMDLTEIHQAVAAYNRSGTKKI